MQSATQKKIVNAAERLILKRGYDGTSLNDVVAAAGVSKGAFFHYFKSKQAISIDVLEMYANEQILNPLEKHLSSAPSVRQGLLDWLQETYNAYAQWKFAGGCLVGGINGGGGCPVLRRALVLRGRRNRKAPHASCDRDGKDNSRMLFHYCSRKILPREPLRGTALLPSTCYSAPVH